MKMKTVPIAILALSLLAAVIITPIHANYAFSVYARTDKASYIPGDSGSLIITIKNTGSQSFTVKNITVDYPWMAFVIDHWDGNFTAANINGFVTSGSQGIFTAQYSFTVPTDSRAYAGNQISITIGTDVPNGPYQSYQTFTPIFIAPASYQPLDLTTAILPVISIVLIAAAVAMLVLVYMGIRKLSEK